MEPSLILAMMQQIAATGCGVMFAVAAIGKLRAADRWREALGAYRLLPDALVPGVALLLPPLELAVAALLLLGIERPVAGIAAAGLLVVFAGAMGINLLRGRRSIDCGCDPAARPRPIGWLLVARNLGLAGAMLLLALPAADLPIDLFATALFTGLLLPAFALIFSTLRSFAPPARAAADGTR